IKVDTADRDALRFWWINKDGQPVAYRFTSVPFGTSTSPFLLYAVMQKHLQTMQSPDSSYPDASNFKHAATILQDNFYVDDLLVALRSASPQQIASIKSAVVSMFAPVSMNVRKWRTNLSQLDQQWAPDGSPVVKLLGHLWNVA